ncbi:hypothetical protein ACFWU3_29535 [Streptomyces sp. NPDC058685]|uniref:hypothetical protein n=1 Tax=Streptomyces sp. NPDC058685 TaxID=3346598 RepID=UPI00366600D5
MFRDAAGVVFADCAAGDANFPLCQAHQVGDGSVAADGDGERGECAGSVGLCLIEDGLGLADPVVAGAERLCQEVVAFP